MPLSTDTERAPSSLRQENKEDGKKISTRKRMALLRYKLDDESTL